MYTCLAFSMCVHIHVFLCNWRQVWGLLIDCLIGWLIAERRKRSSWMDWVWPRWRSWETSQRSMLSKRRSTAWWNSSSTLSTRTRRSVFLSDIALYWIEDYLFEDQNKVNKGRKAVLTVMCEGNFVMQKVCMYFKYFITIDLFCNIILIVIINKVLPIAG